MQFTKSNFKHSGNGAVQHYPVSNGGITHAAISDTTPREQGSNNISFNICIPCCCKKVRKVKIHNCIACTSVRGHSHYPIYASVEIGTLKTLVFLLPLPRLPTLSSTISRKSDRTVRDRCGTTVQMPVVRAEEECPNNVSPWIQPAMKHSTGGQAPVIPCNSC